MLNLGRNADLFRVESVQGSPKKNAVRVLLFHRRTRFVSMKVLLRCVTTLITAAKETTDSLSGVIYRLVPSPSRYEIGQFLLLFERYYAYPDTSFVIHHEFGIYVVDGSP